jgi:uncharacterized protein (DUF1330 family)
MAAYMIARVNVTDWDQYNEYIKVTPGIIAKYDGRFIVRGGEMVTLEGPEEKWRVVHCPRGRNGHPRGPGGKMAGRCGRVSRS